ncbi:MAG: sigma-70 family RNA polymerase sigma factor [Limnochordales bacterium]|nr:sigma-70 family RNA polymerase sigma factor [Limnochordales bacterium]
MTSRKTGPPPVGDLIARCLTGDVRAFETLVRTHHDQVYGYACRMVGPDAADDVVQEVFLRVYRSLHTFRSESDFKTWLYRITTNACLDHLRRMRRQRGRFVPLEGGGGHADEGGPAWGGPERPDPGAVDPALRAEQRELAEALQAALGRLSDHHRAVLVLHDMYGFRYDEIKDILRCSLGTVKSRLFYARRALREQLRPYLDAAGDWPASGASSVS